jgi:hypothetical protein
MVETPLGGPRPPFRIPKKFTLQTPQDTLDPEE